MEKKTTVLMILDGFGLNDKAEGNAVKQAKTPVLDGLMQKYPFVEGYASGLDVGLPAGQMGNSEVGHTNIGGGRVVFQDLPRISRAIDDGSFFENAAYNKAMDDCLEKGSSLHLYGLLSDGGVHSHIQHLYALLQMARNKGLPQNLQLHPSNGWVPAAPVCTAAPGAVPVGYWCKYLGQMQSAASYPVPAFEPQFQKQYSGQVHS